MRNPADNPESNAIPFLLPNGEYIRECIERANEIRQQVKKLKEFIERFEGADSPAYVMMQERYDYWKAICSLSCKRAKVLRATMGGAK
jgi:hypothetical protein